MTNEEAFDAMREIIREVSLFVLATVDADNRPHARWMGAVVEDPGEPGLYYMVCGADSRKVHQVTGNKWVELLFASKDWSQLLNVSGTAALVGNPEIKKMVWDNMPAAGHYYSGPDDPGYGVLSFRAESAEGTGRGAGHRKFEWRRA